MSNTSPALAVGFCFFFQKDILNKQKVCLPPHLPVRHTTPHKASPPAPVYFNYQPTAGVHFAPGPTGTPTSFAAGNTPRRVPEGYQALLGQTKRWIFAEASPRTRLCFRPWTWHTATTQPSAVLPPAFGCTFPRSRRLCTSLWLASTNIQLSNKMDEEISLSLLASIAKHCQRFKLYMLQF